MSVLETSPRQRPAQLALETGMAVLCADVQRGGAVRLSRPDGTTLTSTDRTALVLVRLDGVPVVVLRGEPEDDLAAAAAEAAAEAAAAAAAARLPRQLVALPSVTVIIPTAGRPTDLERCLRSLDSQRLRPEQVLVVDNDPADVRTREVVARVAARTGLPLVHVAEPRRGSSIARNTGLGLATGEVVAFTDDDVLVDDGWTAELAASFADPEVGCVTGMVMPAELATEAQVLFERYGGFSKGVQPQLWRRERGPSDGVLHPYACGTFGSGNNMAFRTSVLRELAGFDEALGAGSPARAGADIEAFLRVLLTGHLLRYEPGALVWHHHRRELGQLQRQLDSYGGGLSAIGTKHLLPGTGHPLALLRRLPAAVRFLVAGSSERNGGRAQGFPPELARAELRGVLAGPWRYVKARWAARPGARQLSSAQAALLSSTALNGVLGIVYWVLAARSYPAADVGIAAAWVASLIALGSVGQLNITGALQRFLPVSGRYGAVLLRHAYAAAVPACLLVGFGFWLLGPDALTSASLGPLLVVSLPIWALFSLQDSALLSVGRAWWIPVENAAYGLLKLAMLAALASRGGPLMIALSWVAPAALAVLLVQWRLFTRVLPAHAAGDPAAVEVPCRTLRRFVGGDFAGAVLGSLPAWLLPAVLVATQAPEDAAIWAAALLVASVVDLGALAVNGPLTVHLARDPAALSQVLRQHLRRLALLLGGYALVAAVLAESLLAAFGRDYAEEGTMLLRLLLLASLAKGAAMTAAAVARARSDIRAIVVMHAIGGVGALGLGVALLPGFGLQGAALGLTAAWAAAAATGARAMRPGACP